ncbi:hypothetical protein [Modicisalibacter coralii]|nr:hypothetical protein [Halomonas coralii]
MAAIANSLLCELGEGLNRPCRTSLEEDVLITDDALLVQHGDLMLIGE